MNTIRIAILGTLLVCGSVQADIKAQLLSMSKSPAPLTEKAGAIQDETTDHLKLDTSVVVESAGKHFSPLVLTISPMNSERKQGLFKGQLMQTENKRTTGKITGAIMVKTTAATLNVKGASETRFGSEYILLSFDDSTELLAALEQLKSRSDIESAELEINTKRYSPK
ncbi:hypothetical protein ACQUQU_01095 [Thalassolituus sp. LLYu03]|uniref:hypothetical protein n=1 Tax=Thalassolituus sp. LLYu03 TaxID=3421656 RepID=UPI003D2D9F66